MQLKRKLPWILTGKALLATGSIAMVALALVTYTATVTITLHTSFTAGVTTENWDVALNDVNQVRFLPGCQTTGTTPTCAAGLQGTAELTTVPPSAFSVQNDNAEGTAVQIQLSAQQPATEFSNFDVTVKYWTGSAWGTSGTLTQLYTDATGTTQISSFSGVTGASQAVGFLHIPKTTISITYFEIVVTYSTGTSPSGVTISFVYTPTRTSVY